MNAYLEFRGYGGSVDVTNKHQLWQIADVGAGKVLIINQETGSYLGIGGAYISWMDSTVGYYEYQLI